MDKFLADPNENSATEMLQSLGLEGLIRTCASQEQASEVLRLLLQLNKFNILNSIGCEGLVSLLNFQFLQKLILEHMKGIEFPTQDYTPLIRALFSIFLSENIGESSMSRELLVRKLGKTLSTVDYIADLRGFLTSDDTIIKIRGLELVLELANFYDFHLFESNGLIDIGIEMATGNDILLRIVAIEALIELGNSELGCKKLLSDKVCLIIQSAFDEESDVLVRYKLILMAAKIFHFTENTRFIDMNFWKALNSMLQSTDPSGVTNALNSIGYLASRSSGIAYIFENRGLLEQWTQLQRSTNQSIKSSFYHNLNKILPLLNESQTTEFFRASNFVVNAVRELVAPFQDTHSDILRVIEMMVKFKELAIEFINNEKFKEFLFKRPPHQVQEVSYLKFEIVLQLSKQELPQLIKIQVERYLKSGIFAAPGEHDMELESLN